MEYLNRKVKKIGGSFSHTGTVVADFYTSTNSRRIVVEFDPPISGMLHIYRPDQVEFLLAAEIKRIPTRKKEKSTESIYPD